MRERKRRCVGVHREAFKRLSIGKKKHALAWSLKSFRDVRVKITKIAVMNVCKKCDRMRLKWIKSGTEKVVGSGWWHCALARGRV